MLASHLGVGGGAIECVALFSSPVGEALDVSIPASSGKTVHQDWVGDLRGFSCYYALSVSSISTYLPAKLSVYLIPLSLLPSLPRSLTHSLTPFSLCSSFLFLFRIEQFDSAVGQMLRFWKRVLASQTDQEEAQRSVKMMVIGVCSIHQGEKTSGTRPPMSLCPTLSPSLHLLPPPLPPSFHLLPPHLPPSPHLLPPHLPSLSTDTEAGQRYYCSLAFRVALLFAQHIVERCSELLPPTPPGREATGRQKGGGEAAGAVALGETVEGSDQEVLGSLEERVSQLAVKDGSYSSSLTGTSSTSDSPSLGSEVTGEEVHFDVTSLSEELLCSLDSVSLLLPAVRVWLDWLVKQEPFWVSFISPRNRKDLYDLWFDNQFDWYVCGARVRGVSVCCLYSQIFLNSTTAFVDRCLHLFNICVNMQTGKK